MRTFNLSASIPENVSPDQLIDAIRNAVWTTVKQVPLFVDPEATHEHVTYLPTTKSEAGIVVQAHLSITADQ